MHRWDCGLICAGLHVGARTPHWMHARDAVYGMQVTTLSGNLHRELDETLMH
jgi:hypothetical protein